MSVKIPRDKMLVQWIDKERHKHHGYILELRSCGGHILAVVVEITTGLMGVMTVDGLRVIDELPKILTPKIITPRIVS